ncbi:DUF2670 domain-containing protein [Orientia tsutsugamushi]|uniref:Uncharacterized protein n=1 Tax=Orientia tsutsugamushi (strain Boryong) TaxID=357244 RepID=A5CED5_ORITB|nr:DUF2670 domain-containing protein [Orientia tsutsugamushi]CAM80461.1 hypothetical protein OTBS_1395 [Orientia tsutsugamushi str. Boryong]
MWFYYFTEPILRYVGRIFKNPMALVPYIFIKKWTLAIYTTSIIVIYLIFTNQAVQEKLLFFTQIMNYELGEAKAIAKHCTSHLANGQWSELWKCIGDHPKYESTEHDQILEEGDAQEINNDLEQVERYQEIIKKKDQRNYNDSCSELLATINVQSSRAQTLREERETFKNECQAYRAQSNKITSTALSTDSQVLARQEISLQAKRQVILQKQTKLNTEMMETKMRINSLIPYIRSNMRSSIDHEFVKKLHQLKGSLDEKLVEGLVYESNELECQEGELLDHEQETKEKETAVEEEFQQNKHETEVLEETLKGIIENNNDFAEKNRIELRLKQISIQQQKLIQEKKLLHTKITMLQTQKDELSQKKADLKARIEIFNQIS